MINDRLFWKKELANPQTHTFRFSVGPVKSVRRGESGQWIRIPNGISSEASVRFTFLRGVLSVRLPLVREVPGTDWPVIDRRSIYVKVF